MEIQEGKFYHLIEEKRETLIRIKRITWGCRDAGDPQSVGWENWSTAYVLADTVGIGFDGRVRAHTVRSLILRIDHEVNMKDLPLYISWPHTSPMLSKILQEET